MLVQIDSLSKYKNKIKKIYTSSFPLDERIDFEDLFNLKFPNSQLLGIVEQNKLVGFSFVCVFDDYAYIVYLAVDEKERNKHYGSNALKDLNTLFKNKTQLLSVEQPNSNDDIRTRRINFYKRNGFELANIQFDYSNETYNAMYRGGKFNKKKFVDILDVLFPGCENFKTTK